IAQEKLANLEAEVWENAAFRQRIDIASAIAENQASGRWFRRIVDPAKGDVSTESWWTDWETLAVEWALTDANGKLLPKPKALATGLIERVIFQTGPFA